MKIVIVTLLITIPTLLFAEKKTIIEPAIMECQYDHIIVQDTLNRSHVMKDRMILREERLPQKEFLKPYVHRIMKIL